MQITHFVAAAAITAGTVAMLGSGAGAAPNSGTTVQLTCGSDSYDLVVVPGQGHWPPGMESDGGRVFHPTRFEDFTGAVYDQNDQIVEGPFSEEYVAERGSSHGRQPGTLNCTYELSETYEDGSYFLGAGNVSGHFSGK